MKRVGTITYEMSEEEYDSVKYYLNELEWSIEHNKKTDVTDCLNKLKQIFDNVG